MWGCLQLSLLILVFSREAEGKLQVLPILLGSKQTPAWQYVGKFGYSIGQGTYAARLKETVPGTIVPNTSIDFEIYVDEAWPEVESITDSCSKKHTAKRVRTLTVGQDGDWGIRATGSISQNIRPHIWYFAVSDCRGILSNMTAPLELEIEYLQGGGSHFSVELQWSSSASILTLLTCSCFIWSFCRRSHRFWSRTGALHPVIWTLGIILLAQFIAQSFHTCHLINYRANGQGLEFLEAGSQALFVLCQIAQTSILVIIALGYTLVQAELGSLEVWLLVCGSVGLLQAVLVVMDRAHLDTSSRYSGHDGSFGWMFFGLRLVLYAWFLRAANKTQSQGGLKLQAFMSKFKIAASLFFLAYPVIFLFMHLFAPYLRETVMELGLIAAQVISNVWLASLFLDRGAYFEASSLSASPLPSAGSPVFFKED